MTHLDNELLSLKTDTLEMMNLVLNQFNKTKVALIDFDKDIIREVKHIEKRVDAFELKLTMDCENVLALFNPVAIDLRFTLAVLKIVSSVERLGDYTKSNATTIGKIERPINPEFLAKTRVVEMFTIAGEMLHDIQLAFETDNSILARNPLKLDDDLDTINDNAEDVICDWIKEHPEDMKNSLYILSIIKRLERFGDQVKNITHEIIFHQEAKVLKHNKKMIKEVKESLKGLNEKGKEVQ